MSDETKPPEEPDAIDSAPSVRFIDLLVGGVVIAWGVAIVTALNQYSSFRDSVGGSAFSQPSAPQISQLADEAMMAVMPMVVVATAITALAIAVGVRTIAIRET